MFLTAVRLTKLRPPLCHIEKLIQFKKSNINIVNHNQNYSSSIFSKVLTHSEKKEISVPIETIFDAVLNVDLYQEFVPWCTESIVLKQTKKSAKAKLTIGYGPIKEHYNSVLIFNKPIYIKAVCTDGRIFNMLECTWKFSKGSNISSTVVLFDVSFEFRSLIYTTLARTFFDDVVVKMVAAFEKRAKDKIYSS